MPCCQNKLFLAVISLNISFDPNNVELFLYEDAVYVKIPIAPLHLEYLNTPW